MIRNMMRCIESGWTQPKAALPDGLPKRKRFTRASACWISSRSLARTGASAGQRVGELRQKRSVIKRLMMRIVILRNALSIFAACAVVLSAAASCQAQATAKTSAPKPQRIKIYFYHEPGEYIDLSPVTRLIRSRAPARAAIEALLAGPTEAERARGFGGLASANEFAIGKLTIRRGTARVNFVASRTWAGWRGDLAPVRFKTAVELTLKQFASVRRVVVSLNGDVNFASER